MMKAKQIEYLIQSLPIPEPEEVQVRCHAPPPPRVYGDLPHGWEGTLMSSLPPLFFRLGRVTPKGCAPSDPRGRDATSESRLCGSRRPS